MATGDAPGGGGGVLGRLLPTRGLTAAEAAVVERERVARNIARTASAAPLLMVLLFGISMAMLFVSPRNEDQAQWQRGITLIDLCGALALAVAIGVARGTEATGPRAVLRRHIGDAMVILGVVIGAALVLNTLHYQFKMIAWVAVVFLTAVLFHPRFVPFLVTQAVGLVVVVVAAFAAEPESAARLGHLTTALGSIIAVIVVERLSFAAFVRETVMRHQLGEINRDLEHRVTQQVREIVANNERIEALNRQLAGKVAARSEELALALRRLALAEHGGETLAPGTVLGDRFEIKYVVGVGGMGVVYAAVDKLVGERVAVKVVRTQSGDVAGGVRFLQEATAAASLSHPAIVRVLHVDVTPDGRLYQALELVEGQTLDACLERARGIPRPIIARLGAVVADALAVAHALGVVHRDVKPQNIMITADRPGCRLLDFGLAKVRETLSAGSLSEHGQVIGTPQFLAPEQVSSPLNITGSADVYALGMVLYLCLSGRLPFQATAPMQWLYAHVHEAPRRITTDSTPALIALIERCIAKQPADRPTARQVAEELGHIADDMDAPQLDVWAKTIDYVDTRPLHGAAAIAARAGAVEWARVDVVD
ncbi:MAG: serine/threonine protein kinase, partial [Deltaproteobacteria bacterium]|nr:serine/threonine protein kinase [Kofleriaceae bacterium]